MWPNPTATSSRPDAERTEDHDTRGEGVRNSRFHAILQRVRARERAKLAEQRPGTFNSAQPHAVGGDDQHKATVQEHAGDTHDSTHAPFLN